MGQADYYRHGSWNVICDRCGFKFKSDQCQMTWDGLFVCNKCYEPRHPQDFVFAKHDKLRVPIARPDTGTLTKLTYLAAGESKGDTTIAVQSIDDITQYTPLLIELDGPFDTSYHSTYVTTTPTLATSVAIADELPYAASSGNTVYIMSGDDVFLAINEVTSDDL